MNAFTIKDLENLSGIKAHTIRIWEQRYSFLKPQRTDTNIRYYTNSDLKLILNIALLNKHGIKISHIDKMSDDEINNKIYSLSNDEAKEERVINLLIQSMVDLNMIEFEEVLSDFLQDKPFEKVIHQIIFPFLQRIGILWLTNHINPAHEHLVSNIIRQKLIVGIENSPKPAITGKTILLFLPENEHHELGILYTYYLLKQKGVNVIYLGTSVPLRDLEYIINRKTPDYAYSHITSMANNFNFDKLLFNLHSRIPHIPIVISGQAAQQFKKDTPGNVFLKKSLLEVHAFIQDL